MENGGLSKQRTHDTRLLLYVVVSLLLTNVVQWAVCRALHLGNPGGMQPDLRAFFHVWQWTDSWLPMMTSLDAFRAHPNAPIYDAKLYDTLIYPLTSELPLVAMRWMGMSDATMLRVLAVASWLAVWGVMAVALGMGRTLLARRGETLRWQAVVAVVLAGLGCYPLMKGYSLGNAQTFLSFGFAGMLWLWTTGREREAGAVAAMLTAVKPQFCVAAGVDAGAAAVECGGVVCDLWGGTGGDVGGGVWVAEQCGLHRGAGRAEPQGAVALCETSRCSGRSTG